MSQNLITNISFGADPEVFLRDSTTKQFKSAIGLIPGSKYDPFLIGDNPFEAIQTDNVMVEYCQEPTIDPKKFYEDSLNIHKYIKQILPSNLELVFEASAEFDDSELDNPLAQEFGCDPDYNAWTGKKNPAPKSEGVKLRTAGGHLHIGYADSTIKLNLEIIKILDLYLTLPSLLLDKDDRRRQMYGKAGAFRHKDYGVELRTLSNFWVASQETVEWVFNNTKMAIMMLNSCGGEVKSFLGTSDMADIQHAINSNDKKIAMDILDFFKIPTTLKTTVTV